MPLSTDITLPKVLKPIFPDKCIVCQAKPDSTARIAQNSQNVFLAFFLPIFLLFGWSRVEVPICRSCKPRFRWQRWGREIVCWTLMIMLVWWLMPHFKGWSGLTRKLAVAGLVLLGLSPYILAEVFWPRIFNTTAQGNKVDYEFASSEYAGEFEALNLPDRQVDRQAATHGSGLGLDLPGSDWKRHRFPGSNVVVALPQDFVAAFDDEGVLIGTMDGSSHHFSATLHSRDGFRGEPSLAHAFLDHLSKKSAATPIDKGTHRYFKDPKPTSDGKLEYTFYVVAIPGAVVVVSIASTPGCDRPAPLARIEAAIPDIIGEPA
jgi:hypothetical protein